MTKSMFCLILMMTSLISAAVSAYPIDDNTGKITHQSLSEQKIKKLTKTALQRLKIDLGSKGQYAIEKVVIRDDARNSPYLFIYLQHRYYFLKQIVRVNLNQQLQISSLKKDYHLKPQDINTGSFTALTLRCPEPNLKFLFITPMQLKSVENIYEMLYPLAVRKYGIDNVRVLMDKDATIANFSNYLTCPNLEGVFSSAAHENIGQSFFLYDGSFDYTFFTQNKDLLNLKNTMIVFNTCYAFDNTSPGMCEAITALSPKFYTSGVTPLTMYGAPEAYGCFWQRILTDNTITPNKALLESCMKENDPFAQNSNSPLYIITAHDWDRDDNTYYPATLTTSLDIEYQISAEDQYVRINLARNEHIKKIVLHVKDKEITCPDTSDLFKIDGLRGSEFALYHDDGNPCIVNSIAPGNDPDSFPKGYAVYGLFPEEPCQSNTK